LEGEGGESLPIREPDIDLNTPQSQIVPPIRMWQMDWVERYCLLHNSFQEGRIASSNDTHNTAKCPCI